MSTDDKRIREFASQIWESAGKPAGQEARHWEMACKLAEAEALAPKKPAKSTASKAAPKKTGDAKIAPDKTLNGKTAAPKAKAKPAAASKVIPPGEKAVEKKPRAARKPPAV